MSNPTFISLYSGAGGLDMGFIAAGFTPVFSNEINRNAAATHKAMTETLHISDCVETCGDLADHMHEIPTEADLIIGGPPCQGFSVSGNMNPSDPRSRCVHDFMTVVETIKPKAFVMENVKSLATNSRWRQVRESIISRAENAGYRTAMAVLDSSRFGVPEKRERMILTGMLDDEAFTPPQSAGDGRKPMTVAEALADLPRIGRPGNSRVCKARIIPSKHPILRKSPYAGKLFNGLGRVMNPDAPAPTIPAAIGGNGTPIVDQQSMDDGSEPWVVGYHRSLMDGGPVADAAPSRLRRISVEEAAAIQTFPEWMPWSGANTAVYRQIGNAVPPRMAYHVALALKRRLM